MHDSLDHLARAVRRGLKTPFLVGDLPFGSYEISDEQAVTTAMRFVKEAGCDAVKLEGGGATPTVASFAVDSTLYGGRFAGRGGAGEGKEGNWAPTRLGVLEFPSMAQARKWYDSPEYAPALALRLKAANAKLILVEGAG